MTYTREDYLRHYLDVRGVVYDVLRRLFLEEPNKQLLQALKNDVLENFPFKDEHDLIKDGVDIVESYFEAHASDDIEDRLQWEYTRMFIGPYELPAPLWESSYVNEERLLFQKETLLVRQAYLKYHFLPIHFGSEADDHLGLELDFLFQLNDLTKTSLQNGNEEQTNEIVHDQISFLQSHLLQWVPLLKEKILAHAQYDFYKGIVKILHGFLEIDKVSLEEFVALKHLQEC